MKSKNKDAKPVPLLIKVQILSHNLVVSYTSFVLLHSIKSFHSYIEVLNSSSLNPISCWKAFPNNSQQKNSLFVESSSPITYSNNPVCEFLLYQLVFTSHNGMSTSLYRLLCYYISTPFYPLHFDTPLTCFQFLIS